MDFPPFFTTIFPIANKLYAVDCVLIHLLLDNSFAIDLATSLISLSLVNNMVSKAIALFLVTDP